MHQGVCPFSLIWLVYFNHFGPKFKSKKKLGWIYIIPIMYIIGFQYCAMCPLFYNQFTLDDQWPFTLLPIAMKFRNDVCKKSHYT
jgi:hypothetical protein